MSRYLALLLTLSVLSFSQVSQQGTQAQQAPQQNVFNAVKALREISLVNANGKTVNGAEVLRGKKLIGLYFSAQWCGPCRIFTPELVRFRDKCVNKNLPFDVIFVSSDNDEKSMRQYMKTDAMRWYAVPYSSELRSRLKSEFKVNGIPTLILLDGNGKVFSKDARWDVAILKDKAYQRWTSPNYKPLTYDDYTKNSPRVMKDPQVDAKKDNKKNSKKDSKKSK
ncbi:MAG: redoxin family protein [Victivallales bacterium]|nr:redoxin family protein [Victivallales bacterium]